jgi:hypothetical protein
MSGLSKEEIDTIGQLLKLRQQTDSTSPTSSTSLSHHVSLVDDYSSDGEEADSVPIHEMSGTVSKHSSGKPKKLVLKKEPIIKRSAGRPKKVRTPEQLAKETADAILKSQRKEDREAKKIEKDEALKLTQLRVAARKEAIQAKQSVKDQKSLESVKKRTEIYGKMLADAEAYKAKWHL